MNKKRYSELMSIKDKLQELLDEEQEYFDFIPENLKNSERAEQSEEFIGYMENALDALDNIDY